MRLRWTEDDLQVLAAREVDPDRVRSVLLAFDDEDTSAIVDAIEDAIEGSRARSVQSLAPLVVLSHYYASLWRAPLPLRVSLRALKRCCSIAWGGDDDLQFFKSTTN